MGSKQSQTASWSVDEWAYGTGANAATLEDVMHETRQIPAKYFGGNLIQNDPSMNQMQNDLLSFDDTLKNMFRRKKNKRSKHNQPQSGDEYYYYEEQQSDAIPQSIDSVQDQNDFEPIYSEPNRLPPLEPIYDSINNTENTTGKAIWRCSNCTVENKITERVCRRCRQSETRI